MKDLNKPTNKTFWVARNADGSVLHMGETEPHQQTSTGQEVFEYTEDEAEQVQSVYDFINQFPDLPSEGEHVEGGQIYKYGDDAVKARQSHIRTHHAIADVPALFLFVPAPVEGTPQWQAGIQVTVGEEYEYEGVTYTVIQSHATQAGWEPPNVPALFSPV